MSLYTFDKAKQCIGTMTIEIDFLQKKSIDSNPYDTDKMAAEFIQQFNNQAFSVGQQVVWNVLSFLSLYRHSRSCSCPQLILLFKNERSFAYEQVYARWVMKNEGDMFTEPQGRRLFRKILKQLLGFNILFNYSSFSV